MKIAVASGKGGTGKTTLAVNLAAWLAERERAVLADLDVEEPNAGLFLAGELLHRETQHKHVPEWRRDTCAFCGRCQEVCNFHAVLCLPDGVLVFPELCHGCYACSELCPSGALPMRPRPLGELRHRRRGRLEIVEGELALGEEQAVPLIRRTLDYLDSLGDDDALRILDAPPGTACPMVEAVRHADLVLLVTEPTPFGLHDLKLAVATVRRLERPCAVVLNRDGIGDDGVERFCRDEGLELAARIPHDRAIAELGAAGELLYPRIPAVREAVASLAAWLRTIPAGRVA